MADGGGGIFSKPKKRARIAYGGEEFGFGFRAVDEYAYRVSHDYHGEIPDGGKAPHWKHSVSFEPEGGVPLRSKDQALAAVVAGNAEYALVPFYSPQSGYDIETLNLLSNMPALGVDQVDAGDRFCLAVYEPQVLDLVQSSHPGSALSYFIRGRNNWSQRATWSQRAADRGVDLLGDDRLNERGDRRTREANVAGLTNIDRAGQMLLRDRVDVVFAGPEATRRCKTKLDGLRAAGVKVKETLEWVEPHREMARRVRDTLDKNRQTSIVFDSATGEAKFTSIMSAEAQTRPLYAVVLPFEVASRSPEFTIIDDNLEDMDTPKTRFLIVEKQGDPTLRDDTYAITGRRVNYWMERLLHVGHESVALKLTAHQVARSLTALGAGGVMLFDLVRYFSQGGGASAFESVVGSDAFGWAAIALAFIPWAAMWVFDYGRGLLAEVFKTMFGRPQSGVRILLQFLGVAQTASLADVEWRLRYFGVRFRKAQTRADDLRVPADQLLDIEFDRRHFDWHPALLRSIVQEILSVAFEPARHGKVKVLAAMPFKTSELPAYKKHRWWLEGARASSEESQKKAEASLVLAYRSFVRAAPALLAFGLLAYATVRAGGVANMLETVGRLFQR
ncbi:MAG: hypothetical protein GC153_01420 [Alphaproteobacteria bacterium]|nr:hypothetical protein [Alphaproteobacteria bacterium]